MRREPKLKSKYCVTYQGKVQYIRKTTFISLQEKSERTPVTH